MGGIVFAVAKFFSENISKIITSVLEVDVMITIFCNFCQFSVKKIGVFLTNQLYDPIFAKFSFVLSYKMTIFSPFFAKIFQKS
jgi:hypothetical protein